MALRDPDVFPQPDKSVARSTVVCLLRYVTLVIACHNTSCHALILVWTDAQSERVYTALTYRRLMSVYILRRLGVLFTNASVHCLDNSQKLPLCSDSKSKTDYAPNCR